MLIVSTADSWSHGNAGVLWGLHWLDTRWSGETDREMIDVGKDDFPSAFFARKMMLLLPKIARWRVLVRSIRYNTIDQDLFRNARHGIDVTQQDMADFT